MTHIKKDFEITQDFIASVGSDDLKLSLENKITNEIASNMLDSIQSGSYISIEPSKIGYTMGIDLLVIDNAELQTAIGSVIERMFDSYEIFEMGAEYVKYIMAPLTFSQEEIEKECNAPFIKKHTRAEAVPRPPLNMTSFTNFLSTIDMTRVSTAPRMTIIDDIEDEEPQQEPTQQGEEDGTSE